MGENSGVSVTKALATWVVLPWSTYTGTKLETADTAKDNLQRADLSSTRRDVRFLTRLSLVELMLSSTGSSIPFWRSHAR
jgi:hypothetical protein